MTSHGHSSIKHYSRFVVLGDSFSEGFGDDVDLRTGQFRGWADRVADGLAEQNEGFTYLNLAIRGKLIGQVFEDQLPIALKYLNVENALVSFHAGANDLLRPSYNHPIATAQYADAVRAICATGTDIMLFTVAKPVASKGKAAERLAVKIAGFNEVVREVAKEVDAVLIEAAYVSILKDRRFWSADRLHLNAEGHRRVAAAVLQALDYSQDSSWQTELPPAKEQPKLVSNVQDVKWLVRFLIPWIWRRLIGRSSGDGRTAKQNEPTSWPHA